MQTRIAIALTLLCTISAGVAGCGGKKGTLNVSLVLPVGADPFAQATKVHITAGTAADYTTAVSGGKFDAKIEFKPPEGGVSAVLKIEATDASGNVVARGMSPMLGILPQDEDVAVFVGPVGAVALLPPSRETSSGKVSMTLATGRLAPAATAIPRLGVLLLGGKDPGGADLTSVEVLQLYSWSVLSGASMSAPRPGAVALSLDRGAEASGFLLLAGGGGASTLDFFEPLAGTNGTWSTVVTDASLARDGAALALLGDGTYLFAGGRGSDGKPLATATTIVTTSTFAASAVKDPMLSARSGLTATPAAVSAGYGALLFGGVDGTGAITNPVAEVFSTSSRGWTNAKLTVKGRTGHGALQRSNGETLIVGGTDRADGTGALDSVIRINLASTPPDTEMTGVLSRPRKNATVTRAGDSILVCGGLDDTGAAIASCDILDEKSLIRTNTVPLAVGRTGHVAVVTDTGNVVIAGGVDASGAPVKQIEVYTF